MQRNSQYLCVVRFALRAFVAVARGKGGYAARYIMSLIEHTLKLIQLSLMAREREKQRLSLTH